MASLKIDEAILDKLAEILKKHNLSEIEYKHGDAKVKLSTFNGNFIQSNPVSHQPQSIENSVKSKESTEKEEVDFSKHKGALKSPMVGTCYLAPEPGASNFISVGDSVQEGQPILIIEAMKVMNLIKAQKSGKIIHIAISNTDPVEYGQLLVVIE